MRPARYIAIAGLALVCATVAGAHDFWLIPNAFTVAQGAELTVHGQTSSAFPTSESAVTTDRLTLARVFGAKDDEAITALSTHDRSLVLRHRPRTSGQKIVAASLDWRNVNETAERFRKYLVLEGAEDALTAELITSDDGTVEVALKSAGLWNVRTIHVVPAPKGVGADWEVHWATFVFEVR